jgi:ribonuclease HI
MSLNVYTWSSLKSPKAAETLNEAVGFLLEYKTEKGAVTLNKTILLCNLTEKSEKMTANEAEMVALKMALSRINTYCELNIYTESMYVANAVQSGWADRWKKDGWKTKAGKDVANRKLWEELFPMLEKYTVRWHVKEPYSYKNWLRDEVEKNRQFVAPVQPIGKDGKDNV